LCLRGQGYISHSLGASGAKGASQHCGEPFFAL
jgi:hypothetical protein